MYMHFISHIVEVKLGESVEKGGEILFLQSQQSPPVDMITANDHRLMSCFLSHSCKMYTLIGSELTDSFQREMISLNSNYDVTLKSS